MSCVWLSVYSCSGDMNIVGFLQGMSPRALFSSDALWIRQLHWKFQKMFTIESSCGSFIADEETVVQGQVNFQLINQSTSFSGSKKCLCTGLILSSTMQMFCRWEHAFILYQVRGLTDPTHQTESESHLFLLNPSGLSQVLISRPCFVDYIFHTGVNLIDLCVPGYRLRSLDRLFRWVNGADISISSFQEGIKSLPHSHKEGRFRQTSAQHAPQPFA